MQTQTINDIETLAKEFSNARTELEQRLQQLKDDQEAIKRRRLRHIKSAIGRLAERYAELREAIETNPALFKRPKTRVLHGIRLGFRKRTGKLLISSEKRCVELIRKLLPEQAEALIKISEKPLKSALAQLTAADLKRLGVRVEDDIDEVLIKAADGDTDRLIDALLSDEDLEDFDR